MVRADKVLCGTLASRHTCSVVRADVVEGPQFTRIVEDNHIWPSQEGATEIVARLLQLIPSANEKPLVSENGIFFQCEERLRGVPGCGRRRRSLDWNVRSEPLDLF